MARAQAWIISTFSVALCVGSVAGYAVYKEQNGTSLIVDPPLSLATTPQPLLQPAVASTYDAQALALTLDALAANPAMGTFGAQVIDTQTGAVMWERNAYQALRPASVTKILTAVAALIELGSQDTIETPIYIHDDTVYIKANGDVGITNEQLDQAAAEIRAAHPDILRSIIIDTNVWDQPEFAAGWDPLDIAGGYITYMQPAMLYGARLGATTGDAPRSTTPALDLAAALGQRLGVNDITTGTIPQEIGLSSPQSIITSEPLYKRLREMMLDSDNIMAEAIGREVAVHAGYIGNENTAIEAVHNVLINNGYDLTGVQLHDVSGLSVNNQIPAAVLAQIFTIAAQNTPQGNQIRELLDILPVAGASGTLMSRFDDQAGLGWVHAKTGTLDGTNALAGVVQGNSGTLFSFAFISNDNNSIVARPILDQMASAIRAQG